MTHDSHIVERARKKATQSICRTKVSALGFNANGDLVISATNRPRFSREGGGIHAELAVMAQARKKGVVSILIARVNRSGELMPIDPCDKCQAKADDLGIRIYTVK